MTKSLLYKILRLLPNLEILLLAYFEMQDFHRDEDGRDYGVISLPKLKSIWICDFDDNFEGFLADLRDCNMTDVTFCRNRTWSDHGIIPFIKAHEKSLKNLDICTMYLDWSLVNGTKEMHLETLRLTGYRGDWNLIMDFLVQNGPTLKFLEFSFCEVNDEIVEFICENFKNLETFDYVELGGSPSKGFLSLHKLKKLQKFVTMFVCKNDILEGFTGGVNENLTEIDAPIYNQTPEFIGKLGVCAPNLTKFSTSFHPVSLLKDVLQSFKKLEYLKIQYGNSSYLPIYPKNAPEAYENILQHIDDHGNNLQEVIFSRVGGLDEMWIREKLKNRKGMIVKWQDHSIVI
jgi:hypothetical protein